MQLARIALPLVLALACAGDPQTPEERVRAVLADLEAAAEARDVAALKEHLSADYRDAHGNDRRAVAGIATMHFLQHESVHLLVRVRGVERVADGEARALALVAMAGTRIESAEWLESLRADLYRFELTLRDEDGDWRVASAAWSPATADDFR
ncbi:MAG: hypothetical protein DCC71_07015 [Proteobacteria bacterium]|nr:MAG: hypothetical protein DCC71_07015 [Pseudomonadota bacterium]